MYPVVILCTLYSSHEFVILLFISQITSIKKRLMSDEHQCVKLMFHCWPTNADAQNLFMTVTNMIHVKTMLQYTGESGAPW